MSGLRSMISSIVDGGVIGDDMGEIDFGLGVIDFDFGANGGFEEEVDGVLALEIDGLLVFRVTERIADEVEFVLKDIVVEGFGDEGVKHLDGGLCAVHLLDHAERHHARTEARHLAFLLEFVEFFLDLWFIVVLDHVDLDGDQLFSLLGLRCVHYMSVFYCSVSQCG